MTGDSSKPSSGIAVFISGREATCDECGAQLGTHAWITVREGKAACLSCSDLDHLVFLPSGDAALTRRAKKHSKLSAVVLKWSKARKRYERQGLLVENQAVEQAESECEADAGEREIRRARQAIRRGEIDQDYVRAFAEKVRTQYPSCPPGREIVIAEHACRKHSGRVGRSAMAKELDEKAVRLAVRAHIRHEETGYDEFLTGGCDRFSARQNVAHVVNKTEAQWAELSA